MPHQCRTSLLQMVLKCADIGHLAADLKTHQRWAYQLEEEFFQQVRLLTCSASIACWSHCSAVSRCCIGAWPQELFLAACAMKVDWQNTACMCCLVCACGQQQAAWPESHSTEQLCDGVSLLMPAGPAVMQLVMVPTQGHLYLMHSALPTEHFCQSLCADA